MADIPFTVAFTDNFVPVQGMTVTLMASNDSSDALNVPQVTDSSGEVSFTNYAVTPATETRLLQYDYVGHIHTVQVHTPGGNVKRLNLSVAQFRFANGPVVPIAVALGLTKVTVLNAADDAAIADAAVYWGKTIAALEEARWLPIRTEDTNVWRTNANGIAQILSTEERANGWCIVTASGFTPRIVEMSLHNDYTIKLDAKPVADGDGSHVMVVRSATVKSTSATAYRRLLGHVLERFPRRRGGDDTPIPGPVNIGAGSAAARLPGEESDYATIFWLTTPEDDSTIISGPVQANWFGVAVLHCQPSTEYHLWASTRFKHNRNLMENPMPVTVTTGSGLLTDVNIGRSD